MPSKCGVAPVVWLLQDPTTCMSEPSCWQHLLSTDPATTSTAATAALAPITVVTDEAEGLQLAMARPALVDALILFQPSSINHNPTPSTAGSHSTTREHHGTVQTGHEKTQQRLEGWLERLYQLGDPFESGVGDIGDREKKVTDSREQLYASSGAGPALNHPSTVSTATGGGLSAQLLRGYQVRMNHSDVPPTRLVLDSFDVVPSRNNALSLYQK